MTGPSLCSHCQLPVGRAAQRRDLHGSDHWFCCYGCFLAYQVHHGARDEPEAAYLLIRLGVGGFLAMNIMLFSLLLYSGSFSGPVVLFPGADASATPVFGWLLWLLATPLFVVLGGPFLRGAWSSARNGRLTADTLVSLGALTAYCYSGWQVIQGSDQVYFDTVTMVLLLFTLGRYLEAQGRVRAARSLAPMLAAERAEVRVLTAAGESRRPVKDVRPGDVLCVYPGERIPVDGWVVDGWSECDESVLTGQHEPRPKAPDDPVHAGSLNGNGFLSVCAGVPGDRTRWIRIGQLVREALARKSSVGDAVDRAAARFIPLVLILAVATVAFWAGRGSFDQALLTGLAVLVVACPCSLGLAVPLATALGIGRAAERGILIRGGAVLERLARLRGIAFDKTGTLTRGRPRLVAIRAVDGSDLRVLHRAQCLALASEHPLARAIAGEDGSASSGVTLARDARAHPGAGVSGRVDGDPCAMGSADFMSRLGWLLPAELRVFSPPEGATTVYVGWAEQVHGCLYLADSVRPEAAWVLAALRDQGLYTLLLSGDQVGPVTRYAEALAIPCWYSDLSPEDKVEIIRDWMARHGPIAMVGDGLNDGPVLAAAAVGIAVGNASDLAKESSDVVVPYGGISDLPLLLQLAQHVRRSIRANLVWALGYNTIALCLAAMGLLQPVLAAFLMAGSSLLVVTRSLRADRAFRARDPMPPPATAVSGPRNACGSEI